MMYFEKYVLTIAEALKFAGYRCYMTGKWELYNLSSTT